jgi:hypothetical protein
MSGVMADMRRHSEYFGLSADFPRERCFVRNGTGEANRNLYLSNEIVKVSLASSPS